MNLKRSAVLMFALAVLMLTAVSAAATTLHVGPPVGTCTGTYPTISSAVAVASPGDTISVCPGSYHELVIVNKQLILNGAQAGVDARSGSRTGSPSTESVVDGVAGTTSFDVTANNVTIDGFTVQGQTNANVFGAGIVLGAGTSGAQVVNNIVQNNMIGLDLTNAVGGNQAVVQRNLFRNNTQPGPAGGHGIYSDQFTAGGAVVNVLIDNNAFTGNTWGIGISNTDTVNRYSALSITNNNFDANSRGMYFFATQNSSIVGNTITGVPRYAIGFFGGDTGFTIHCNTIKNNPGEGIFVEDDLGAANSNITANDNIIAGNATAGVDVTTLGYSGGAGSLNAERNWWGSPTGPTIASNPGGTGDKILDPDGVVDYTPWDTSVPDADNDGIIDACDTVIGPPTKDQCKNGGWQIFTRADGSKFKNQGDCVSYTVNGK